MYFRSNKIPLKWFLKMRKSYFRLKLDKYKRKISDIWTYRLNSTIKY